MDPGKIRIAPLSPPHCSACFGAKPGMRHVDMGAAWDGPMLEPLEGAVGVIGHSIDDMVICEECVKAAALLVDMVEPADAPDLVADLAEERERNERLHAELVAAEAHVRRLEDAGASREKLAAIRAIPPTPAPKRSAGPKKPHGRPTGRQRRTTKAKTGGKP